MKVVWGRRARRDLYKLISYIAEESLQAAELVSNRIDDATHFLAVMPGSGRPGRVAGTRELVISRTPYILVYRIKSNSVRIIRVYHAARRWPTRFE